MATFLAPSSDQPHVALPSDLYMHTKFRIIPNRKVYLPLDEDIITISFRSKAFRISIALNESIDDFYNKTTWNLYRTTLVSFIYSHYQNKQ